MTALPADARPRLAAKVRLRFDRKTERHLLLYPERGLVLSPTAVEVVRLCTGEHTVAAIVDRLAAKYAGAPRARLEDEVRRFLDALADRGLVSAGP
ncbi:MAG TPA: pyrroloquinoline quinone biosynthesis peptide chaperone PqqD [Candidatus Binatia bacterium]|nr:pyrroloquinoline quinone biosynthesis peptide chaperone PqqD [Candidatus Binatia bacterium]